MTEERKTPLLDELEKGPWPSFVKEIKKSAKAGKAASEGKAAMPADDPATLVSTDWLEAHLKDPDLRVLDEQDVVEALRHLLRIRKGDDGVWRVARDIWATTRPLSDD
mgnify:CR=1 FL=1